LSVFRLLKVAVRERGVKALPLRLREKLIRKQLAVIRGKLTSKRQELRGVKKSRRLAGQKRNVTQHKKRKKRKKSIQQEIFQLENDLRAAKEERAKITSDERQAPQWASESRTGALPDFLIIGAKKCGTSFLYDLLSRHPYVQPAAKKELHYFDVLHVEEGIDWYRRCFPAPSWKDGRRTITGEATPYLDNSGVPERVAKALPQARLIALLRDPVERAYSDHQQVRRKGREPLSFEEATEAEKTQTKAYPGYLSRGVYIDQLLCWSMFFGEDQMLVLKSEDLFEHTEDTLERVLDFLDLPRWKPEASEKRNKGEYEAEMEVATRQRLQEYFEPHNERLYEYLGTDFEWQQLYTRS
jgi:hypothetical protein